MTIHVYKLISGETVIAEFVAQEIVNEKTNTKVHMVKYPLVVRSKWWEWMDEWLPGMNLSNGLAVPIPLSSIIVVGIDGDDTVNPVLIEAYEKAKSIVFQQTEDTSV